MTHSTKDWHEWHSGYHEEDSPLKRRLAVVQAQLRNALPAELNGPLQVVSVCAGQGRDIIEVLAAYPHAHRVKARLVELDERNVAEARKRANEAHLGQVEIITGDAALLSAYAGAVPADIVLVCGVFGNISERDIFHTIDVLPQFCRNAATVIWTRSRRVPDITPAIRGYFEAHRFTEVDFIAPEGVLFSVGVNRYDGESVALRRDEKLFTFLR
ncbi:MAG TPA: class I SAM-dependent methyltransferase [Ktedonobacterales bacterium]